MKCKTCADALKLRIEELVLRRKRFLQNIAYFQTEIKEMDLSLAILKGKTKRCG